jgi:hypothetical protein
MTLSETDCYRRSVTGVPIVALRSSVMFPFADEASMDHLMACIAEARAEAMG